MELRSDLLLEESLRCGAVKMGAGPELAGVLVLVLVLVFVFVVVEGVVAVEAGCSETIALPKSCIVLARNLSTEAKFFWASSLWLCALTSDWFYDWSYSNVMHLQ